MKTIFLSLAADLLGGILSHYFAAPPVANAQMPLLA